MKPTRRGCRGGQRKLKCSTTQGTSAGGSTLYSVKKKTLPCEEFSSFRPISKLIFLSKGIEKVVTSQIVDYLEENNLYEKFQSAYKKHHSVETALIRVQNACYRQSLLCHFSFA